MAKTIKNTKTKQKSAKLQKPTLEQKIEAIREVLIETNEGIVDVSKTGMALARRVKTDFEYHESMRKIQDEYIESNFKIMRWAYLFITLILIFSIGLLEYKTNKIEKRLTQVEMTYEISRHD